MRSSGRQHAERLRRLGAPYSLGITLDALVSVHTRFRRRESLVRSFLPYPKRIARLSRWQVPGSSDHMRPRQICLCHLVRQQGWELRNSRCLRGQALLALCSWWTYDSIWRVAHL